MAMCMLVHMVGSFAADGCRSRGHLVDMEWQGWDQRDSRDHSHGKPKKGKPKAKAPAKRRSGRGNGALYERRAGQIRVHFVVRNVQIRTTQRG